MPKDVNGVYGWKQLVHQTCLYGENQLEVLMPELSPENNTELCILQWKTSQINFICIYIYR